MGSDLWSFSGGSDCDTCCRKQSTEYSSGKSESAATCADHGYPVQHGHCTGALAGSDDPYSKFCPTLNERACADTPAGMVCQWCKAAGKCVTQKETCTKEEENAAELVVTSAFCYGGSNCSAPCTENQASSGACSNEEREGRLLSFRFACNASSVLYETFAGYGCHSAQRITQASFNTGMCYPNTEGTAGTQYSCTAAEAMLGTHKDPPFEPCAHDTQCGKNGTYKDSARPMCCLASPMAPGLGKCCAKSNCVATYNPYTGAVYVCNETSIQ